MTFLWPVVPLCEAQLKDVREEDVLYGGLYRKCDTYRGGGGYDRFPYLFEARYGEHPNEQFVVQLQGCHLKCPYCYVTPEGVDGRPVMVSTEMLIQDYVDSGLQVLHLMGGAPARYIEFWPHLIERLFEVKPDAVFHSDLLLTEKIFSASTLKRIARDRCLYAVGIKGMPSGSYVHNTGLNFEKAVKHLAMIKLNAGRVHRLLSNRYAYFTFTNCTEQEKGEFERYVGCPDMFADSFDIDLVQYEAIRKEV